MKHEKLSPPIELDLNEFQSLQEIIDFVYSNYFKVDFMDKNKRERINGDFIYLDLDFVEYKPERFWHLISFNPSDEKYTVNPCVNSRDFIMCRNLKEECQNSLSSAFETKLKERCECIYRLRRIHWINEILKLANENDESIKLWYEDIRGEDNYVIRKTFIRFQEGVADYIIILMDGTVYNKKGYKFITAYPVVHNGTKKNLDNGFREFSSQSTLI